VERVLLRLGTISEDFLLAMKARSSKLTLEFSSNMCHLAVSRFGSFFGHTRLVVGRNDGLPLAAVACMLQLVV